SAQIATKQGGFVRHWPTELSDRYALPLATYVLVTIAALRAAVSVGSAPAPEPSPESNPEPTSTSVVLAASQAYDRTLEQLDLNRLQPLSAQRLRRQFETLSKQFALEHQGVLRGVL
ncbi:MAG: hypothetical protein AAF662_09445, partial [Pseudomonadota bacterium]